DVNSIVPNIRFAAVLLGCLTFASVVRAQPLPPFKSDALLGTHPVGLRVVEQYDRSRTFQPTDGVAAQTSARPIQTLIWYPASASTGNPLTWGDYVAFSDTEVSFGKPQAANRVRSFATASLGEGMAATRDAEPAPGRFPVVIYAPSFSSGAWENAELCEY